MKYPNQFLSTMLNDNFEGNREHPQIRILVYKGSAFVLLFLLLGMVHCNYAATIDLVEYGINVDGSTSFPKLGDILPANVDSSSFDETTGLGTLSIEISDPGSHFVSGFFDHEIDEAVNTFFNEIGSTVGSPALGESWEIDEPGFVDGDIFINFSDSNNTNGSSLDLGIGTSVFGGTPFPDDVSMAIGWEFSLSPGETGIVSFLLGLSAPSGFHLVHHDPDTSESIYLSSSLQIQQSSPIPEPSTVLLLLFGSAVFGCLNRRSTRCLRSG